MMPPTLGLVAAAILGAAIFAVAWWNRAQRRLDAGRLRVEDYAPVPYVEPSLDEEYRRLCEQDGAA